MGDSIATNMFMLGYALQKGWVPVSGAAVEKAIAAERRGGRIQPEELRLGPARRGRSRARGKDRHAGRGHSASASICRATSTNWWRNRVEFLTAYQDAAYAARYKELVEKVRRIESEKVGGTKLTEAVARYYAKLMAYKDEYEVARLHSDPAFMQKIEGMFEGDYKVVFHLAPPHTEQARPGDRRSEEIHLRPVDDARVPAAGEAAKACAARAFDIFGRTEERRTERALIVEYAATVEAAAGQAHAREPRAGGRDRQRPRD